MKDNIKQMNSELKKYNTKKIVLQSSIAMFSLIILILSLITLASTVKASDLAFGRYRFYIMRSASQPEIAEKGDLVIAKKMDPGKIKVGDNIVYCDNDFYYCNSVIEAKNSDVVNNIVLAEKDGIKYRFCEKDIEGKIVGNVPNLGFIVTFLRTPLGFVFFALIILCVFVMLRVAFVKKADDIVVNKNGNEDA